ncbi:MAG: adenylate/guanylate cyclase domain-containing protein, partial [Pseudomonadota bacterium]
MEKREATVFFAETTSEGEKMLVESVRDSGGRHLKAIGSAHLCLFDNPQAACDTALKLLRAELPLPLRVGIAKGTVTVTGEDAFGEVVNLAARLQGIARPGEVYFSGGVLESIDRARTPFKEIGTRQFKGIGDTVHVYSLLKEHAAAAPKPKERGRESAKELFDFTRVDQERIAEEEALRSRLP